MKIGNSYISDNKPPFIIAEISANHNGSLAEAKNIIFSAKQNGANAVKIQTYTADTMTIDSDKSDFKIKHGLWKGSNLFELYKKAETPFKWQKVLFEYANSIGITIFSTPFDESAVDLLESLNTPAYKIASFEITDLPLIKYVASKGKPMLISTGMSNEEEIGNAVEIARSSGCSDILLFHCISSYPAKLEESNLSMIHLIKKTFKTLVGLSDHSHGNEASIIATAIGASAIEKHFILDRNKGGPDSPFSIEPKELASLSSVTKAVWQAKGKGQYKRSTDEIKNTIFRRSIYFIKDMSVGEIVTQEHVRRIRPGFGLHPRYYDKIIGLKVIKKVKRGERVTLDVFDKIK